MNATAIFGLLEKGITLLPALVSAGMDIYNLATRMAKVAKDAKDGKPVEQSELDALESELDAALAEFNAPLPPE